MITSNLIDECQYQSKTRALARVLRRYWHESIKLLVIIKTPMFNLFILDCYDSNLVKHARTILRIQRVRPVAIDILSVLSQSTTVGLVNLFSAKSIYLTTLDSVIYY